ncbi:2-octaprenyl-6-methoxyphenol hydroxylase [Burkholderiales bacterium]|nr:2-octaprenyl-6-methoxyphenol hydroxylase [Burkholderiales bacterium]
MGETLERDVLIAGAGLPGLALAVSLARAGLSVAIADRNALVAPEPEPESWDVRVYAISPGSAAFLHSLGAWQALPEDRISAVEGMRIEGDRGAVLEFDAYELSERALAWIVEERALRAALVAQVHEAGVDAVAPAGFAALEWSPARGTLVLDDGRRVSARLVVGADGVRSWVRRAAGISAEPRPYGQSAIVANFACARPHGGVAYQWFRADGGVLAWLPLPGDRISIVWSAPDAQAHTLGRLDPDALAERVAEAGGGALGKLDCITPSAAFPLAFLRLPAVVAHRLALVGDAAHGVHPLAGQGVNLGFGDAQALAAVEAARGPVGDPGAPILLERYGRRRAAPVIAMQAVTDGLARLFGSNAPGIAAMRNLGLAAVSNLPLLRRALAQPALR